MNTIKCCRCNEYKPVSEFYLGRPSKDGKKRFRITRCKSCDIQRTTEHVRKIRQELINYGGGQCKNCGYNKCLQALEFHHRDPSEKELNISRIRSLNAQTKQELDKCDLLCSNCHREVHYL